MNQYAQSLSEVYSKPSRQQGVSVGFTIPFSLWGENRNNARIALNDYRSGIIRIDVELDEFENDVDKTINNYYHNVNLWMIAERAFRLAQNQYKLTVREFAMGRASAYQLIASQQEQSTAMMKYYTSVKDAFESYYKLRDMTLFDFEKDLELLDIFLDEPIK